MKFTRYPKRDAIRDYFPVPNEIFCLGLSTGEIAVYAYLMYCEGRKTFQCHPSYKTIGKAVGMSKNTVRKHVDGLTKKRLITTEPTSVYTQKGEKRNDNLLYTVRPIEDAVEYHYEQQMIRLESEMRCQSALKNSPNLTANTKTGGLTAVLRSVRKQAGESRGVARQSLGGSQRTATPTAQGFAWLLRTVIKASI